MFDYRNNIKDVLTKFNFLLNYMNEEYVLKRANHTDLEYLMNQYDSDKSMLMDIDDEAYVMIKKYVNQFVESAKKRGISEGKNVQPNITYLMNILLNHATAGNNAFDFEHLNAALPPFVYQKKTE